MISPREFILRAIALVIGLVVTLRATRRPTRRGRSFWRVLGIVTALTPCLVTLGEEGRGLDDWQQVAIVVGAIMLGLAVAALALVRGLRGRRVGDHEYCRHCGFDLFGRPAGTRVCGECGARLDVCRATVIGQHQRRPQSIAVGVFLLVVTLGYGVTYATNVYRWATTADLSRYKPTSWLIDDLWSKNMRGASAASLELSRRLDGSLLDRATASLLVDRVLAQPMPGPAFPGIKFNAAYAMAFAERAWARDAIDEAAVHRAMRAALDCTLFVAPQASRGRTMRYWIAVADYRLARPESWHPAVQLTVDNASATLDERPLPKATWSTLRSVNEWTGRPEFGNAFDLAADPHGDGPATLSIRVAATLTLALSGRPTLVETRDVDLTGMTTLVEPAAMACPPVTTPPAVAADGTVTSATTIAPPVDVSVNRAEASDPRTLNIHASASGAILADVVLTSAGTSRTLATICLDASDQATIPFDDRPAGPYMIELRPVPERGADLFRPVATFAVPIVVSSATIPDTTGP